MSDSLISDLDTLRTWDPVDIRLLMTLCLQALLTIDGEEEFALWMMQANQQYKENPHGVRSRHHAKVIAIHEGHERARAKRLAEASSRIIAAQERAKELQLLIGRNGREPA